MTRMQYVVGLCFDPSRNMVAMVQKRTGPECVIGNWNGIGGKIEPDEAPTHAMSREFFEEAGVLVEYDQWHRFGLLNANDYDLYFFYAISPKVFGVRTMEHEEIRLWLARDLLSEPNLMMNMRWMIPFIQDPDIKHDLGILPINR